LPWLVGFISVLPFWLGAYAVYQPFEDFSPVSAMSLTSIYGGVNLSLIAGSKWGVASVGDLTRRPMLQMATSFLIMLGGFVTIVLPVPEIGLSILLAGFVIMALWDLAHSQTGIVALWYVRLRVWLTIFTIGPLIALMMKVL